MLIHLYRVKHKPTGLYYTPGPWSNLSEKGKIYSSGNNVLNFFGGHPFIIQIVNQKTLKKYQEKLVTCGDFKRTGQDTFRWFTYYARKEDFEIETLTFVNK